MVFDITQLKKIRKQLDLTQHQFAKNSGVSQSMIAKIEAGKLDPTYSYVRKIEDAMSSLTKHKEKEAKENPKEAPKGKNELNEQGLREGDGVWEKTELIFYLKDEENVLTKRKREIIISTITSTKEGSGGYYGWNKALEELNRKYPDNIVPDKLVEIENEINADIVITVHSQKEFCCDLTGDPIIGKERSQIDENNAKIKSTVDAYNIIRIDEGFLEDMMRHELGHTMGIFGHVVNRQNDLMSIVSPASVIKDGNLQDLYVKYRNRIIESMEESIKKDESVVDRKVKPPS